MLNCVHIENYVHLKQKIAYYALRQTSWFVIMFCWLLLLFAKNVTTFTMFLSIQMWVLAPDQKWYQSYILIGLYSYFH